MADLLAADGFLQRFWNNKASRGESRRVLAMRGVAAQGSVFIAARRGAAGKGALRHGSAGLGKASRGVHWGRFGHGMMRQVVAWQCKVFIAAWTVWACLGSAGHCKSSQGFYRGGARLALARFGKASRGVAWRGFLSCRRRARLGTACPCRAWL